MIRLGIRRMIPTPQISATILAHQILKDRPKSDALLLQMPLWFDGDVGVGGTTEGNQTLLRVHGGEVGRVGDNGATLLALEDDRAKNVAGLCGCCMRRSAGRGHGQIIDGRLPANSIVARRGHHFRVTGVVLVKTKPK